MEVVRLPKIGWKAWDKREGVRKSRHRLLAEPVLHSASAGSVVLPLKM